MSIRLVTLGPPRCYVNDTLTDLSAQKLRFAILLYIASQRTAPRESVAALFWPDRDEERARHALSQNIYELRRLLGDDWLGPQADPLEIGANVFVDAHDFENLIERTEYDRALALYQGDFLDGFHVKGSNDFDSWVEAKRRDLKRSHHRIIRERISRFKESGDVTSALALAHKWAELDPLDDAANHALIALLAASGKRSEALDRFSAFESRLRAELDVAPLDDTIALVTALRDQKLAPDGLLLPGPQLTRSQVAGSREQPQTRQRWAVAGAVMGVLLMLAIGMYARETTHANTACFSDVNVSCHGLDTLAYVVMPFAVRGDAGVDSEGYLFAHAVHDQLSRISDLRVAHDMRVNDALRRMSENQAGALPVDSAILIARRLGVGNVVLGEIFHSGDSVALTVNFYDAESGRIAGRTLRTRLAAGRLIADGAALVRRHLFETQVPGVAAVSNSLGALREFAAGESALAQWDLGVAGQHFRKATEEDSVFSAAFLRLAQVEAWRLDTTEVWRYAARRARALNATLPHDQRLLASALGALADRRYSQACEIYRALLARDSTSFTAWYGMGDCLAWDTQVQRDPNSPSGFKFATSYNEAIHAYVRALTLVPSFNLSFRDLGAARLARLLFLTRNQSRVGYAGAERYFGWPELVADTLQLIPYPPERFAMGIPGSESAREAALDYNRRLLLQTAIAWSRAFPTNGAAFIRLSEALEALKHIASRQDPELSALDAANRARRLAPANSAASIHAAALVVRLHLKTGAFTDAQRLADSLGRDARVEGTSTAVAAAMRMLTGHPVAAARIVGDATAATMSPSTPFEVAHVMQRLRVYAAAGVPVDSIRVLGRALDLLLSKLPLEQQRAAAQDAERAAALAFPVTGLLHVHRVSARMPAVRWQRMLRDSATRVASEYNIAVGTPLQEGIEPDLVVVNSRLQLALGDTVAAVRELDAMLNNLPGIDPRISEAAQRVGALIHAMALRAELAHHRGERRTARYWARNVITLWSNGEESAKATVMRMRAISRS